MADQQGQGSDRAATGPLNGLRVIEMGGIGPGPFAAMLLADMGAEVVRIDRPGPVTDERTAVADVLHRGRRSVVLDLRREEAVTALMELVERADVLIEGFRPGVMERLGAGPETCLRRNPSLVYGRMTGWGQDGPWASMAGHDINYIALAGALHPLGREGEPPAVPLNLLGDFGGGSLYLVSGVLAALWEAGRSGRGQVVDAAVVDGAASLTTMLHGMLAAGAWTDERGVNLLDTGRPWYDVYQTEDGGWMSVGPLEIKFYAEFAARLGLPEHLARRPGPEAWPQLRSAIASAFAGRTRKEWEEVFAGSDACVAPVLSLKEATEHPHLAARQTFVEVAGVRQPAPAPRFDRTPASIQIPPVRRGQHTREVFDRWGVDGVEELLASGAATQI
ncbi:carnitine dehydratase [Streptomyces sp. NWU339]|uniref:CaiB/BaiF CoA transferase family protein n=1 Tax=Streptomyces sp. NWU339 TaxID=2185284 RepID=UPI000D67C0BD|nr:CaiB/BaiF CoA-transferase family protein [Streptomyces sp. NWU339]PWI06184.1 carnitine dehydratase [Streptomyces sp. NWU339]